MDKNEKWQVYLAIIGSVVLVILLILLIHQLCILLANPAGLAFVEAILHMAK